MLKLKNFLITLIFCFNNAYPFSLGTIEPEKEIKIGMILYHLPGAYLDSHPFLKDFYRKGLSFTNKGYEIGYFKNSHKDDSFYFQIKRNTYKHKFKSFDLITGYGAGLVTGYCAVKKPNGEIELYSSCKNNKWVLHPAGELFIKAKKGPFSLNISYSAVVLIGTVSFYFD